MKLHADICELLGSLGLWYLDLAASLAARLPLAVLPIAAGECALCAAPFRRARRRAARGVALGGAG